MPSGSAFGVNGSSDLWTPDHLPLLFCCCSRFVRQVIQSLPPILDMLTLVFFVMLIYR